MKNSLKKIATITLSIVIIASIQGCASDSRLHTEDKVLKSPVAFKHSLSARSMVAVDMYSKQVDRENYAEIVRNGVVSVTEEPVSTFGIDVDTASYSNMRRMLNRGVLPRKDAIRTEEMINYFDYDYPLPKEEGQHPFSVIHEVGPTPWNQHTHLLHIGLQGYKKQFDELPPSNLVFLIDVSGSMKAENKLPLVKKSLGLLLGRLRSVDMVSIVVYAGASGVVLKPTSGTDKITIQEALKVLEAGGSTNGGEGIELAYDLAQQSYVDGGINRVILATDGDFNVGMVDHNGLIDLVERKRDKGIFLTTLGYGAWNLNDHLMEQLADKGNGNYAYIDTLQEANKVLIEEVSSTLFTIAKDVKIQVEFNPSVVAEYRLIGYENRMLEREDFNNDSVDTGDMGAGHNVTALYEIALVGSEGQLFEELRYGKKHDNVPPDTDELAFVRLKYKSPDGDQNSRTLNEIIRSSAIRKDIAQTSGNYRLSAAVAAFGEVLTGSQYIADYSYEDVMRLIEEERSMDKGGQRGEFYKLINLADTIEKQ